MAQVCQNCTEVVEWINVLSYIPSWTEQHEIDIFSWGSSTSNFYCIRVLRPNIPPLINCVCVCVCVYVCARALVCVHQGIQSVTSLAFIIYHLIFHAANVRRRVSTALQSTPSTDPHQILLGGKITIKQNGLIALLQVVSLINCAALSSALQPRELRGF